MTPTNPVLVKKIAGLEAKAAAYQHAGESLEQAWTADDLEQRVSVRLANQFHKTADKARIQAGELERNGLPAKPEKAEREDPGHDTPGAGESSLDRTIRLARALDEVRQFIEALITESALRPADEARAMAVTERIDQEMLT